MIHDTQRHQTPYRYDKLVNASYKRKKGRNRSIAMAKLHISAQNIFEDNLIIVLFFFTTVWSTQCLQSWITHVNMKTKPKKTQGHKLQHSAKYQTALQAALRTLFSNLDHHIDSAEANTPTHRNTKKHQHQNNSDTCSVEHSSTCVPTCVQQKDKGHLLWRPRSWKY